MTKYEKTCWRKPGLGSLKGLMAALVFSAVVLPGCITAAVTTAVIMVAGTAQYTAKVEVKAPPDRVYAAMLRILERRTDVTVDKRDDAKFQLEVSKGKNKASAQVAKLTAGDLSELKVTARENETDMSHKELALKIVQQVCDELGVKYEVVEKK
jgi:hypothetical protein